MVTKKGNKSVKELSSELSELRKIVEHLQEEINNLKKNSKRNDVAFVQQGNKQNKGYSCTKCSEKFTEIGELKVHVKSNHQIKVNCHECNYEGISLSDLEKHIMNIHGNKKEFKCAQCKTGFVSTLRLEKHVKSHHNSYKISFCHYYNNDQECPFQSLGCKFKHSDAKHCKDGKNCKRKMCQFKHSMTTNKTLNKDDGQHDEDQTSKTSGEKANDPRSESHLDGEIIDDKKKEQTVTSSTNEKSEETDFKNSEEFYCEHFCASEFGIHVHDEKEVSKYKGVNMDEIKMDDSNKKCKLYTCVECEFKSKGLVNHRKHFKDVHGDLEYSIGCLLDTYEFESANPKERIRHFEKTHNKSVKNCYKR